MSRCRRGLTLLEAVLALAVATGAITALLLARATAVRRATETAQRRAALELAEQLAQRWQAEAAVGWREPTEPTGRVGSLTWEWQSAESIEGIRRLRPSAEKAPSPIPSTAQPKPRCPVWTLTIRASDGLRREPLAELTIAVPPTKPEPEE